MSDAAAGARTPINVFFDVDHTLVFVSHEVNALRPRAHDAMRLLKAAGHGVYVWSAGGKDYVERIVDMHGLRQFVDGCFDKDPKVQPRPDFIIDDDWYLVEKYGGHCVSQYKAVNDEDAELLVALESLAKLGHL
ncbi:MAG: HAD family hydrolase [Dehalococcoidia bacterium]|nr:HAD family hydrolase [Dehalococcoidia bacterium]